MKHFFSAACLLLAITFCVAPHAGAQNLATKKIITKYSTDYIPEFQSSLAGRSGHPALGKIAVDMDFASFGDDAENLDLAVRQLNMAKGALLFIAKDADGKQAIESGVQRIVVRKAAGASGRTVSLSNGTLTLAAVSYDLRDVIGTSEIQKLLMEKL